ncbi:MAG TPA: rRNA maturation RNase YbeY [Bryobacteraceae bacterium]|nr:rRNA maturation RNase YbeY [Bryobacteraceae bacterium]
MSPDGSTFLFRSAPKGLDRKRLRHFQDTLSTHLTAGRSFTCLLTSDAELRRLNATFLGHDYPTDVLSFPSEEGEESLGDLAISAPRAKAQSEEFGHPIEIEIEILMLHGVLHLLGHDHETDKGAMRRLETRWRTKLGLPAGLIERARR